jgi:hypothetical protein
LLQTETLSNASENCYTSETLSIASDNCYTRKTLSIASDNCYIREILSVASENCYTRVTLSIASYNCYTWETLSITSGNCYTWEILSVASENSYRRETLSVVSVSPLTLETLSIALGKLSLLQKKKKSLSPHEKASLFALGKLHLQYCVTGFLHDKGLLFLFYGPASCRKALVLMYNKGTFLIHEKVHLVKQHATWNKSSRVSENLFKKLCLETVSGSCVRKLFQETVSGILCQEAESGNCI